MSDEALVDVEAARVACEKAIEVYVQASSPPTKDAEVMTAWVVVASFVSYDKAGTRISSIALRNGEGTGCVERIGLLRLALAMEEAGFLGSMGSVIEDGEDAGDE